MSLCYREQRQLRGIEAGLLQSDSPLTAMLYVFDRLYSGQDMPASEQVPSGQDRDRRAVTRIAVTFAVAALAISILFSAALTLPSRSGAPASGHRPPSPSAPGQAAKPSSRERRDRHKADHSRNTRRVRRCAVSKPAAHARIRSASATRSVSAAAWAR